MERYQAILGIAVAMVGAAFIYHGYVRFSEERRRKRLVELQKTEAVNNAEMVLRLKHMKMVTGREVEECLLSIDRADFVDSDSGNPYAESALPIGFNATISAPHMHALGLDMLSYHLKRGAKVLDVGSGSGFMTACFAHMVGTSGRVYGIEHIQELVDQSLINIAKHSVDLLPRITIRAGDGFAGDEAHAPFDVIYLGAAAPEIPSVLVSQLKIGGVMLLPVGPPSGFHQLTKVTRTSEDNVQVNHYGNVRFVPMTSRQNQVEGSDRGGVGRIVSLDGPSSSQDARFLVLPTIVPAPDSHPSEYNIVLKKDRT